ncbi:O23 family O-antigen flippase [Morganella morganii]|uniref:O23 family O-antigen flippase n=1 Tax=Morganella morganii TaxID=582 RepID=A0A9Q4CRL2_MORMO|nr:O23 family O-antigen flippase [Morganella morganii]MCY0791182.1 O23 family O-antigen flippase [Morganella morganii]
MYNKIIEKIKTIFYPCLSLGASSIFFISIGSIYGLSKTSDLIFLTLTVVTTIGTILQISWYGFLPKLASTKSKNNLTYIISNSIFYCAILNSIPILISYLFKDTTYLIGGFIYSLFFQMHQLMRNIFIYLGKVKYFYFFDFLGYSLNMITLVLLNYFLSSPSNSLIFLSLSLGWLLANIIELYLLRIYLKFFISLKPLFIFVAPTVISRLASCGFILKDLLMAFALNTFTPIGGLTIYTYLNKLAISIFQVFSIYKVNIWISKFKTINKNDLTIDDIKKISFSSSIDYIIFLFITLIFFYILASAFKINYSLLWAAYCILTSGLLYLIQSIEQPFARYVYINKLFSSVAKADFFNFTIYILVYFIGYLDSNIYLILFGLIISQIASLYIYTSSSKHYLIKIKSKSTFTKEYKNE